MNATVLLQEIVDALEMQFEESPAFVDLDTGRVETVSNDLFGAAEADDREAPDPSGMAKAGMGARQAYRFD